MQQPQRDEPRVAHPAPAGVQVGERRLHQVVGGSALTDEEVGAALEQRLAKYKLPKRIVFVREMPRNAMGKVQKAELRQRYRELYNPEMKESG